LKAAHELQLESSGRPLYLFRGRTFRLEAFEDRVRCLFQLSKRVAWPWSDDDLKFSSFFTAVLTRPDRSRTLLVVHERLSEARGSWSGRDRVKDLKGEPVIVIKADCWPSDIKPRDLHAVLVHKPFLISECDRRRSRA